MLGVFPIFGIFAHLQKKSSLCFWQQMHLPPAISGKSVADYFFMACGNII
jgi:hypothetical protein